MEKALAAVRQLVEDFKAQESYRPPAKPDADLARLEMQCEGLDRQIDEAVYELYALTEEEKRIVEGGTLVTPPCPPLKEGRSVRQVPLVGRSETPGLEQRVTLPSSSLRRGQGVVAKAPRSPTLPSPQRGKEC